MKRGENYIYILRIQCNGIVIRVYYGISEKGGFWLTLAIRLMWPRGKFCAAHKRLVKFRGRRKATQSLSRHTEGARHIIHFPIHICLSGRFLGASSERKKKTKRLRSYAKWHDILRRECYWKSFRKIYFLLTSPFVWIESGPYSKHIEEVRQAYGLYSSFKITWLEIVKSDDDVDNVGRNRPLPIKSYR